MQQVTPEDRAALIARNQQRQAEQEANQRSNIFGRRFGRDGPLLFLSSADFASTAPKREWLVPGVLAASTHGLMFGPEKSFKTSLALDLAISGATGSPFLGEFAIPSAFKSIIISAESGPAVLSGDADTIARAKGSSLSELSDSIFWSTHRFDLSNPENIFPLHEAVWATGAKLLIIDPAYQILGAAGDSSDLSRMGERLSPLAELAAKRGCAVVLVHHALKGLDGDWKPPKLSDINGAGFGAWAAQWMMTKPARPRVGSRFSLWFSTGCRGAAPVDRVVEINRGESGDEWLVSSSRVDDFLANRREAQKERRHSKATEAKRRTIDGHKARIIEVVEGLESPETKSAIRAMSGVNPTYFRAAWEELEAEGAVVPASIEKNGRKENGWSVGTTKARS